MADLSADLANYFTVAGISLASWKWFFAERLRKSREIPSLEGTIEYWSEPIATRRYALQVDTLWRNTGPGPLHVDCSRTSCHLALSTEIAEIGPVTNATIQQHALVSVKPLDGWLSFVLEPNTTSRIQVVLNLEQSEPYFFSFHLPLLRQRHSLGGQEVVFDRIGLIRVGRSRGHHGCDHRRI